MMNPRRLCPVCGAKMEVLESGVTGYYLACKACPLEYGFGWDFTQEQVVELWEDAPNSKRTLGRTRPKAVVKVDQNGNVLDRYRSLSEAAKKNPMSKTSIENRTRRKLKNEFAVCDFTFRLEDDIN